MTKLLVWLDRGVLWPIWALLVLLVVLLFSQPGLRFSLFVAEKALPTLQIGSAQGSWLGGVTLTDIRWQQPDLDVQLDKMTLRLQKRCLIQFRLCIPELNLAQLTVVYAAITPDETLAITTPSVSSSQFSPGIAFPIPLKIDNLQVTQADLTIEGQQLTWEHFSVAIHAWGNRIQLNALLWQQLSLQLQPAEQTPQAEQYLPPSLPELQLPLAIFIEHAELLDLQVWQGEQRHALDRIALSAQVTPHQVRILDLQLFHPLWELQLTSNIDLLEQFPLTASINLQLLQAEFAQQNMRLHLHGDLSNLNAELSSKGQIELALLANIAPLTADLPLRITASASQLQWPLQEPNLRLIDTQLALNGTLSALELDLRTQLQGDELPTSDLQLTAKWQHWLQQLSIQKLNLDTLGGTVSLNGEVAIAEQLSWRLNMALDGLQPEQYWPDFPGLLRGSLATSGSLNTQEGLQLELDGLTLDGELRRLPVQVAGAMTLQTTADFRQWRFVTPGLQLGHGENLIQLQGELAEQWLLQTSVYLPDLAKSYPDLAGQITGELSITGEANKPNVAGQLAAKQLRYQELQLGTAELAITVDSARDFNTSLSVSLRNGRWKDEHIKALQLQLNGDLNQHNLAFKVVTDQLESLFTTQGRVVDQTRWQGNIEQFTLTTLLGQWQIEQPVALTFNPEQGAMTIAAHCWLQDEARLCLDQLAQRDNKRAQATLSLTDYNLARLNAFLPHYTSLAGTANANLAFQWQDNAPPELNLTLAVPEGTLTHQLDLPVSLNFDGVTLNAEMAAHQLAFKLNALIAGTGQFEFQGLVSNLNQQAKPLRAELRLNELTLDFLKPLLDEYSELAGTFSSQLSVDGLLSAPELNGELRLAGLKIRGQLAPTDIDQADILVKFQGDRAELEGKVKTPEGQIELLGLADWQDLANWQADLAISGEQIRIQVPHAELFLQPDLMISTKPEYAKISGSIFVPRGTINVDSLPQNAIGLSNDLILLDQQLQPIQESSHSLFNLETDINLRLGQQVRLQAFGLRTRLVGELRIQQQQFNPNVRGEVALQDGTFRAIGQDLLIRQGKLTFNGPADQPFLNVEAIRNPANMEDEVIAGVRVTGPADDPIVTIFSEPAKPQANALSYLIMGKDLDSESGFNSNSITTGLIGMSIASSGKLVGEIGQVFGVSDLMLDTEGAGDNSQVTVSGYLTRDLQLKYGIGIFQPIGQFTLRYRLMRNLYLEAVSGLDNAVDLLYKFEFD